MRGNQNVNVSISRGKILPKIDSLLFELARRTLPCLHNKHYPIALMFHLSFFRLLCILLISALLFGCSDDKPDTKDHTTLPPTVDNRDKVAGKPTQPAPVVYIEELDQFQEYFKEQHETSFSHVGKKNWMSYTAGKDGILTKIMLFGKPNYTISEHYGSSMSGFIRAGNPDSGPKFGEWSLTREEIVNQLALQGLTEIDSGWITLQMRGEIPQQAGKMYFIVCDQIGDKRAWFGAFAFAEGNSYKGGRFWLHPDHDLVFRTYVGKTADQIQKEERGEPLFDSETASLIPANDVPESPKPMLQLSQNFEAPAPTPVTDPQSVESPQPLYQPATQAPDADVPLAEAAEEEITVSPQVRDHAENAKSSSSLKDDQKSETDTPKRSLFERFYKNNNE